MPSSPNSTDRTPTVGGLVGSNYTAGASETSSITGSYSSVTVTAESVDGFAMAGGLIGQTYYGHLGTITISDSYATGDVAAETTNGRARAGGLVSHNDGVETGGGTITFTNTYAGGSVTADSINSIAVAGGLIGFPSSYHLYHT